MTFLLIPPYLIFAFFVMWRVLKKQPDRKRKWRMGLLTAFLLYLPFGWDVILGRAVFYTLCATQGGVHVYQTVELGPEYWNEDGSPKFIMENGELDENIFGGRYESKRVSDRNFSKLLNIGRFERTIIDRKTGGKLGTLTRIMYFGGWFLNHTGFVVGANDCPSEYGIYPKLLKMVFIIDANDKGEKS